MTTCQLLAKEMRQTERVSERPLKTCTFSNATIRNRRALRASVLAPAARHRKGEEGEA